MNLIFGRIPSTGHKQAGYPEYPCQRVYSWFRMNEMKPTQDHLTQRFNALEAEVQLLNRELYQVWFSCRVFIIVISFMLDVSYCVSKKSCRYILYNKFQPKHGNDFLDMIQASNLTIIKIRLIG